MDSVQGILLRRSSGQVAQQMLQILRQLWPGGWEREGRKWKAFPAVACALVLKKMLSKSFCIFIQIPLTTAGHSSCQVHLLAWLHSALWSAGQRHWDTVELLGTSLKAPFPSGGFAAGAGAFGTGCSAATGFYSHLLPGHSLFPAGGQVDGGLHEAADCPYSVQDVAERLPAGCHSCLSTSLWGAVREEGAEPSLNNKGCASDVAQAAGAPLQ